MTVPFVYYLWNAVINQIDTGSQAEIKVQPTNASVFLYKVSVSMNSALNPIVYFTRMKDFRDAVYKLLQRNSFLSRFLQPKSETNSCSATSESATI